MTEHRVKIAEWVVAAAPARLVAIGLGSCVAIVLFDAKVRVGALAHILLPSPGIVRGDAQPGRSPCSAVPRMLEEMRALGANGAITARLVGGASLFGAILNAERTPAVGARNIEAARAALAAAKVRVIGEAVGGQAGRSVYFDVASGRLDVRSVRAGDRVL